MYSIEHTRTEYVKRIQIPKYRRILNSTYFNLGPNSGTIKTEIFLLLFIF